MKNNIILASASPRRSEILKMAGIFFDVIASDVDESIDPGFTPDEVVKILAERKAKSINCKNKIVIGSDTVVALGNKIFGKPKSEQDAFSILSELSGKIHQVYTGVCVIDKSGEENVFSEKTDVEFFPLTCDEIKNYIKTGEPMDKAGAYAIQGLGALFIKKIDGDFYNVMGLPISKLCRILKNL